MWLLRRNAGAAKARGEVPPAVVPAAPVPMRRIEITVERQSITRLMRTAAAAPGADEGVPASPGLTLPEPPDG
jgi:hypothetical protein